MPDAPVNLRERTRRAVAREIAEAAQRLFAERGYEATKIDDIAATVGMSPRSVFRYFATKEDIIVGKLGLFGDEAVQALRDRPADEPLWRSLRRAFDVLTPHFATAADRESVLEIQAIVFGTPGLMARYLQRLHALEDELEVAVRERAADAGVPIADDDPAPRALIGAAFGSLLAAQRAWAADGARRDFGQAVDAAMAAVRPLDAP